MLTHSRTRSWAHSSGVRPVDESVGILLRALYPVAAAHHTHAVERTCLRGTVRQRDHRRALAASRRSGTRHGRDRTRVQVNGKLRASIRVPARRTRPPLSRLRSAMPRAEVCRRPGGEARDRRSRQTGQRGRLMRRRCWSLLRAHRSWRPAASSCVAPDAADREDLPRLAGQLAWAPRFAAARSSTNAQVVTDRKDAQAVFDCWADARARSCCDQRQGRARNTVAPPRTLPGDRQERGRNCWGRRTSSPA